jgi:hypothetical protein
MSVENPGEHSGAIGLRGGALQPLASDSGLLPPDRQLAFQARELLFEGALRVELRALEGGQLDARLLRQGDASLERALGDQPQLEVLALLLLLVGHLLEVEALDLLEARFLVEHLLEAPAQLAALRLGEGDGPLQPLELETGVGGVEVEDRVADREHRSGVALHAHYPSGDWAGQHLLGGRLDDTVGDEHRLDLAALDAGGANPIEIERGVQKTGEPHEARHEGDDHQKWSQRAPQTAADSGRSVELAVHGDFSRRGPWATVVPDSKCLKTVGLYVLEPTLPCPAAHAGVR